jgi:hypothetical protein
MGHSIFCVPYFCSLCYIVKQTWIDGWWRSYHFHGLGHSCATGQASVYTVLRICLMVPSIHRTLTCMFKAVATCASLERYWPKTGYTAEIIVLYTQHLWLSSLQQASLRSSGADVKAGPEITDHSISQPHDLPSCDFRYQPAHNSPILENRIVMEIGPWASSQGLIVCGLILEVRKLLDSRAESGYI